MKSKKLILFVLFLASILSGQNSIIPNGDFESSSGDCSGSGSTFNSNVQNWKVSSSGSSSTDPATQCVKLGASCVLNTFTELCSSSTGNSTSNNKVLRMRRTLVPNIFNNFNCNSFRKDHVGVALENGQKFSTAKNYIIRYKLLPILGEVDQTTILPGCSPEAINTHLRFFLSENGPLNWEDNGNNTQELINVNFQQTNSLQNFPPCNWIVVQRSFTPSSNDFTSLIILVESGGVLLDDVEIFEDCESNYLIQNKDYLSGSYQTNSINGLNFKESSSFNITAGNNVGKPNTSTGDVTIQMFSNVIYTAPNEIALKSGFKSVTGSEFKAVIANCGNQINRVGLTNRTLINDEVSSNTAKKPLHHLGMTTSNIDLFPNPTQDKFTISLNPNDELPQSISVRSVLGNEVKKINSVTERNLTIDLSDCSDGVYIVNVNYADKTLTNKIVKTSGR